MLCLLCLLFLLYLLCYLLSLLATCYYTYVWLFLDVTHSDLESLLAGIFRSWKFNFSINSFFSTTVGSCLLDSGYGASYICRKKVEARRNLLSRKANNQDDMTLHNIWRWRKRQIVKRQKSLPGKHNRETYELICIDWESSSTVLAYYVVDDVGLFRGL